MGSDDPHPTYPNPTIFEAQCIVEVELAEGSQWSITRPADFLHAVREEYPNVFYGQSVGVAMIPGVGFAQVPGVGFTQQLHGGANFMRLVPPDGPYYLIIGDRQFGFGHQAKYPGWQEYRRRLVAGWQKFVEGASPTLVKRVGLKYVNIIPRTEELLQVSQWLKPTASIPETVIASKKDPFFLRAESWVDTHRLQIVMVGITQMPTVNNNAVQDASLTAQPVATLPPILFEIEEISTAEVQPDAEAFAAHLDELHEAIWAEFSAAGTDTLRAHLKRSVE